MANNKGVRRDCEHTAQGVRIFEGLISDAGGGSDGQDSALDKVVLDVTRCTPDSGSFSSPPEASRGIRGWAVTLTCGRASWVLSVPGAR
jgi:hypothetical protein